VPRMGAWAVSPALPGIAAVAGRRIGRILGWQQHRQQGGAGRRRRRPLAPASSTRTATPIASLVSVYSTAPLYNTSDHAGILHAESWALVHYLALAPEVRDQNLVNKYL